MSKRFSHLSATELALLVLLILVLGFSFISLKAWLLGIVLGWFGVALGFWKNFLIVVLFDLLVGSASRSSSN